MEVCIWKLKGGKPIDNCCRINPMSAGEKRDELLPLPKAKGHTESAHALDKVFDDAGRNDWIHGCVLNPRGDFSKLTKFRVRKRGNADIHVTNEPTDLVSDPFKAFHMAWEAFETAALKELGVDVETCNAYLVA